MESATACDFKTMHSAFQGTVCGIWKEMVLTKI